MEKGLTEKDMERIAEFQATRKYNRTPEQLLPDTDDT